MIRKATNQTNEYSALAYDRDENVASVSVGVFPSSLCVSTSYFVKTSNRKNASKRHVFASAWIQDTEALRDLRDRLNSMNLS